MRASNHDQTILQVAIQNKIGLKITGDMRGYEGILTGVAKKVYQKYLEDEKRTIEKETKGRRRRRANLDTRQKKIAKKSKGKLLRVRDRT